MPRFCANLTMLFAERPFMERFAAARVAGFDAVEVLFPYDVAVPDILKVLARNDLPLATINCPPPNYTGGARGFAAVAGSRFRQDFKRSVRYAAALGVQHYVCWLIFWLWPYCPSALIFSQLRRTSHGLWSQFFELIAVRLFSFKRTCRCISSPCNHPCRAGCLRGQDRTV